MITVGAGMYAIGTAIFVNPHNLAPGGATGAAIILARLLALAKLKNVPIGLLVFLINIPLLIVGLKKFGKDFLFGTVYGTVVLSILIYLFETLWNNYTFVSNLTPDDPLISGAAGGLLMALGVGLTLRNGGTTGGTDIVVKLLRLKYRHLKTGKVLLVTDAVIAVSSIFITIEVTDIGVIFSLEPVLYSLVAMFVCSMMLDLVLYGPDGAKLVYIVSDKSTAIAERVTKEVNTGGTFLEGVGAYSLKKTEVLMCVVKKHLYPKLKDVVMQEDPHAFLIVTSASEVYGLGYKDHSKMDQ